MLFQSQEPDNRKSSSYIFCQQINRYSNDGRESHGKEPKEKKHLMESATPKTPLLPGAEGVEAPHTKPNCTTNGLSKSTQLALS